MGGDEPMPMNEGDGGEMEETTASLPAGILQGQKVAPGDVVRLEVTSVDEDTGDVTVKYATSPKPSEEEPRGIEGMAAEFE